MSRGMQTYQSLAQKNQRDELILSHLALVKHVLGRLAADLPPGVDTENLESAGVLGLVEAANNFDPARNVQFNTFAYLRVRGAIIDELRRNSPLPQAMLDRVDRIRRAQESLPHPIALDQLAQAAGMSEDEAADTLTAMRFSQMVSFQDRSPPPVPSDRRQPAASANLEREEQARLLTEAIQALPEQQRLVVTLYYTEDLRLKEIAEVLHLSESRISRLLSTALFALRGILNGC